MMPGATTRYPLQHQQETWKRARRGSLDPPSPDKASKSPSTRRQLRDATPRSSTSLNAELRPTNNNRFNSHRKTRQSRHNHTRHDHAPTADHAHPPDQRPNRLLKPRRPCSERSTLPAPMPKSSRPRPSTIEKHQHPDADRRSGFRCRSHVPGPVLHTCNSLANPCI
jgi:hypothetical protein